MAELLDWLPPDELDALGKDIAENGQKYKIKRLKDGRLIDGRNRELACLIEGIYPDYETVELSEDKIPSEVASLNLIRRHLSREQRQLWAKLLSIQGNSTRQIAKLIGVNQSTAVRDLRSGDAFASPEIQNDNDQTLSIGTQETESESEPSSVEPPPTPTRAESNGRKHSVAVQNRTTGEPPEHSFADVMNAVSALASEITSALNEEASDPQRHEEIEKLRHYLSWCGLVYHDPRKSGTAWGTHAVFIQLKGVRHIIDLAGQSGRRKTESQIKRAWDVASGGVLVHPIIRRYRGARNKKEEGNDG